MSPPPPPSPPSQQHSRINLSELKAQIIKKIGPERSHRYFSCLNRFFSLKLGKANFDKLCFLTLGRENLPLHNLLIRSILKNASSGRVPPPAPEKEASKLLKLVGKRSCQRKMGTQKAGHCQFRLHCHLREFGGMGMSCRCPHAELGRGFATGDSKIDLAHWDGMGRLIMLLICQWIVRKLLENISWKMGIGVHAT